MAKPLNLHTDRHNPRQHYRCQAVRFRRSEKVTLEKIIRPVYTVAMRNLCRAPACRRLAVDGTSYCLEHAYLQQESAKPKHDSRPSPSRRGYGTNWRKIRERILASSGIPREQWRRYDIDHNPPYNPAVEPDHNKYTLIPRLHGDHSRKTIREDGGFGHKARGYGW
jgi:hypothetical protein